MTTTTSLHRPVDDSNNPVIACYSDSQSIINILRSYIHLFDSILIPGMAVDSNLVIVVRIEPKYYWW